MAVREAAGPRRLRARIRIAGHEHPLPLAARGEAVGLGHVLAVAVREAAGPRRLRARVRIAGHEHPLPLAAGREAVGLGHVLAVAVGEAAGSRRLRARDVDAGRVGVPRAVLRHALGLEQNLAGPVREAAGVVAELDVPVHEGEVLRLATGQLDLIAGRAERLPALENRLVDHVLPERQVLPANLPVGSGLQAEVVAERGVQAQPVARHGNVVRIRAVAVRVAQLRRADAAGLSAEVERDLRVRLVAGLERPVLDPDPVLAVRDVAGRDPGTRDVQSGVAGVVLLLEDDRARRILEFVVDPVGRGLMIDAPRDVYRSARVLDAERRLRVSPQGDRRLALSEHRCRDHQQKDQRQGQFLTKLHG